jgi:hypothetical protein
MQKTANLYKNLLENLPEDAQAIADYTTCDSEYIPDIIQEIADSATPCYNSGLLDWLNEYRAEAVEYIEEAANEFEFGTERPFSFWRLLSSGYYMKAERAIYDNLEDVLKCWAYCYIWKQLKIEEINEEQADAIDSIDYTSADTFSDIIEEISDIFADDAE